MTRQSYLTPAAVLFMVSVTPANAHLIGTSGAGFGHGLLHPFTGLDHLLAMIAVGFWAAQQGGRATVLLPLCLAVMMAVGAISGSASL